MTGVSWLQKYKELSEGKKTEQPDTEEVRKEALAAGKARNDELHKQQLLHRRAAFESDVPRSQKVSGVLGRPEIIEENVYGKVITHVKGINATQAEIAKDRCSDKPSQPEQRPDKNTEKPHSHNASVREVEIEHATQSMLETASNRFGVPEVESLHIAKDDVGSAISALVLGPAICKQMGPEQTRDFGKRLIVFGVAPVSGMAEETRRQFTEHTKKTVHDGTANILIGSAVGALLEHVNPLVLTTATVGGGGFFLKDQLTSPEHQARNNELVDISNMIGGASSSQIFELSDRTKKLLGPDLYNGAFTVATGGIGVPAGPAINVVAHEEVPGLTRINPEVLLKSLKNLGDETWDTFRWLGGERPQMTPATAGGPSSGFDGTLRMQESNGARDAQDGILKMQGSPSGKESPFENVKKILDECANKPIADKFESLTQLNAELLRVSKSPVHSGEQAAAIAAIERKVQEELTQLKTEVTKLKPQADLIESKPEEQRTKSEEALLEKCHAGEDALDTIITDRLKARYGWDGHTPGKDDLSSGVKSGLGTQREISNTISRLLNAGLDRNPEVLQILQVKGIPGEKARGWIGLPMPGGSAADHAGCDYLLVNRSTGDMYPIDVTENCNFVRGGRVVDSKLMNSSLISDKPADRQKLVIGVPRDFEIDNATDAAWKKSGLPGVQNADFEEALRNRQIGEIIGHLISHKSGLNILDAQLPASQPGIDLSRQAYELWKFSTDLRRLGYPEWANSLKNAIGYLKIKDRNIPKYF